jgi:hypothetical protein
MPSPVELNTQSLESTERPTDPLSGIATNVWSSVTGLFQSLKGSADNYSRSSLGLDNSGKIDIEQRSADQLVRYRAPTAPAAQLSHKLLGRSVELMIISYFVERLSQSFETELEKQGERAVARWEHKKWVTWTVGKIQDTANIQNQQGWLQMASMFATFAPNFLVTKDRFDWARSLFNEGSSYAGYIPSDAVTINSWQKQAQNACGQVPMVIQGWTQTQQALGQSDQHKGSTFGQLNQERAQSAAGAKSQAKQQADKDVDAAVNLLQSAAQIARQAAQGS